MSTTAATVVAYAVVAYAVIAYAVLGVVAVPARSRLLALNPRQKTY